MTHELRVPKLNANDAVYSHAAIPAAFVAVKVRADAALGLGRQLSRAHRCLIGLPELLVKAVAGLREEFPLCFATPSGDAATVTLADRVNVGVTVDAGQGLRVPVIAGADRLGWAPVAQKLMRYRFAALDGAVRAADLTGGNIMVALHTEPGVTVAVPIVFPGQVCAVSLGGLGTELALDGAGAVVAHQVVTVGLAFDHRVVNGREAVEFLGVLKRLLETPAELAELGTGS